MNLEKEYRGKCIVEGVSGIWHYHIAPVDQKHEAYCGAFTMLTEIPWTLWGDTRPYHLPVSYCKECEKFR